MMSADFADLETLNAHPPAPEGFTIYVVGDIHGRLDLLRRVHGRIDDDKGQTNPGRPVEVYLGDYIDRGPDAAGVVASLITRADATQAVFLRGNHEQMLLDFLDGADCLEHWRAVGGTATLLSYGIPLEQLARATPTEDIRQALKANLSSEHHSFYERTGAYIQIGSYLAVHAGVRPGVSLEEQKSDDLLGIRQEFLQYDGDFGFVVVHGHTPVAVADMRRNRINIDTGAFATNRLTCLRLGEGGVSLLDARP